MFSLKSSRSHSNLAPSSSSSSTPLPSPRPTKTFPTGLQSPLQLSTPTLSDTSDTTLQSTSSDGWSPTDERGFDEARARGRSQPQAESEGSSGGGRGLSSLFKRARSSSRGRKKEEEQPKAQQPAPPVPAIPSNFRLSLGLGAMGPAGAGIGIESEEGLGGNSRIRMVPEDAIEARPKPSPTDGGDLGDLLYLVHAAGDRFTSEPSSSDWSLPSSSLPSVRGTSQKTTPTLLQPSAFASPDSPPSPATPKPYYSFLSHLGNDNLAAYQPMTPPSTPPNLRTHSPPKPESEDDYGGSSSDEEAVWSRRPNAQFSRAQNGAFVPPRAPTQVKAFHAPTRARRRALGPKAKEILDYTLLRLSPNPSTLSTTVPTRYQLSSLHHPRSTTPHRAISAFGPLNTVRVVLGRTLIARKLSRGLTMLESMDLERSASRSRRGSHDSQSSCSTAGSFDEAAPRPPTPSLTSLIDTFTIDVNQPPLSRPTRPALSPLAHSSKPSTQPSSPSLQPARLRNWIARPSFIESHLNTLVIEGGIEIVDLVRPAKGKVSKLVVSERLKAMAGLEGVEGNDGEPEELGQRLSRERQPSASSKEGQQRGGLSASSLPPPAAVGRKPVLPGPLLLRALAQKKLNGNVESSDEEEDLPLAVLRSRGSSTPVSTSSSSVADSSAALQKAQARAEKLEAEVSKLRKQEEARQASLTRMQREKEQREIEWEEERREERREEERKKRLAEQRRRSRAAGQMEAKPAGARSTSKVRQYRRASTAPPSKHQTSLAPAPSAYAVPFLPATPQHPWSHPHMLAVPPPGWGIVPVPVMMPLVSPNGPSYYSPQPSPRFSISAPSHTSTSPFSTFAQAGAHRPHPPPLPHSHSAPNRITHRSSSTNLKTPPTNAQVSMHRSSSHGPPINRRSSRHDPPPPLPSTMAPNSGKRVSFKPSASLMGAHSVGMERSRSSPESSVIERERTKTREQLVGGAGGGGRKLVRQ